MTDKTKYSNISVTKKTYSNLQKLSKEFLPGGTPLSISKTVDVLVNDKLQSMGIISSPGNATSMMAAQSIAHVVIVIFIIFGNITYFITRKTGKNSL